jgi:hypothetical protein
MQVVRIDRKGRALDHVVAVSKRGREDVMWVAQGNQGPWEITFDKGTASPFSQGAYQVPEGGFVRTTDGPVHGTEGNIYKYNVKNAKGDITDDPDVDIDP